MDRPQCARASGAQGRRFISFIRWCRCSASRWGGGLITGAVGDEILVEELRTASRVASHVQISGYDGVSTAGNRLPKRR